MAIKNGIQSPPNPSHPAGKAGKEILVPLTTSLYVPGRLSTGGGGGDGKGGKEKAMVIVDIGTGYYVEKVNIPFNRLLIPF